MTAIKEILDNKGHAVWSVKPSDSVYHALEQLAEKGIGALCVVDDSGQLAGFFSERDYARKVILKGKDSVNTPVAEIMATELVTVTPETSVDECMNLMTDNKIRHLPVLENENLVGLVSIGDLVKHIIAHQEQTISQLEQYIIS